jgi:hypothetical protein|tara:strand:+ start:157818 stop:158000 length:183 start_codon:yes stop_codon:yes gene_type:complete
MSKEKSYVEKWQEWAANATPISEAMAAPEIAPTPKSVAAKTIFRSADAPQQPEPYYPAPY